MNNFNFYRLIKFSLPIVLFFLMSCTGDPMKLEVDWIESEFDKFWNFIPQGDERSFPNTDKVLKNILILPVSYKSKTIEIYKMVEIINNI